MAGFLKQLQNAKVSKRSPADERSAVVRSSRENFDSDYAPESASFVGSSFDHSALDDSRLLMGDEILLTEGLAPDVAPTRAHQESSERHAARKDGLAEEGAAPWWLVQEVRRNPQLDKLVEMVFPLISNLEALSSPDGRTILRNNISQVAAGLKDEIRVTKKLLEQSEEEILKVVSGYGPLESLIEDSGVTDIFVDGFKSIRVIRSGHAADTPFNFRSQLEYQLFLRALLLRLQQPFGADHPIVDGILPDKFRVRCNIVHESVVEGGESRIALQIPRVVPSSFFDLLQQKVLPATLAAWLAEVVAAKEFNILVVGSERSARGLLGSALASAVGSDERIVVVESAPMFSVASSQVERLVPQRASGSGSMEALLELAIRRSPHRVVVGDLIGGATIRALSVLESGCYGSVLTVAADTTLDGLWHLVDGCQESSAINTESLVRRVSRAVQVVLVVSIVDGKECLQEISEVVGAHSDKHSDKFVVQPLVKFIGVNNGKRQWQLQAKHSRLMARLRERGSFLVPGPNLLPPPQPEIPNIVELTENFVFEQEV